MFKKATNNTSESLFGNEIHTHPLRLHYICIYRHTHAVVFLKHTNIRTLCVFPGLHI